MYSKAWVLCLLFLLTNEVPLKDRPDVNCEEMWKKCWAHCQLTPDPQKCYDQCMNHAACRKELDWESDAT